MDFGGNKEVAMRKGNNSSTSFWILWLTEVNSSETGIQKQDERGRMVKKQRCTRTTHINPREQREAESEKLRQSSELPINSGMKTPNGDSSWGETDSGGKGCWKAELSFMGKEVPKKIYKKC